jgi:DNA-binding YbaB/EbfC family protein
MSEPDLSQLFAKAQEMQSRLAEVQRELARRTVEASAGGGMVTVVASGELRIIEVRIEPGLIESGDRAMLQDLVAAAANAALADAQKMVQQEMQRVAGLPLFVAPGSQDPA